MSSGDCIDSRGIAPDFWHKEDWKAGRMEDGKGENFPTTHRDQVKRFRTQVMRFSLGKGLTQVSTCGISIALAIHLFNPTKGAIFSGVEYS